MLIILGDYNPNNKVKIFEAAVYKRIVFVYEAFEFFDRYNNGF